MQALQSQGEVRNVKQVGFELGLENRYGRCGSDKIWQTVPDTIVWRIRVEIIRAIYGCIVYSCGTQYSTAGTYHTLTLRWLS